jgi:pyridoxal phosphate enzyme (YggS family)
MGKYRSLDATERPFTTLCNDQRRTDLPIELRDAARRIRDGVADAAAKAGRRNEEIVVMAVTKKHPASTVANAISCGFDVIGENYVREAQTKRSELTAYAAEWHLIGHLQTNKAPAAIMTFDVIQSVDSDRIAEALSRSALAAGVTKRVLVQVHLGNEPSKSGVEPAEAVDFAARVAAMPGLILEGLMGIAPFDADPRGDFRGLRQVFDSLPAQHRRVLSMGMTSDYRVAIEEGSTMVRIGTALFGRRS